MAEFVKKLKNISKCTREELNLEDIPENVNNFISALDETARGILDGQTVAREINRVSTIKSIKDTLKEKINEHTALVNYRAPEHHIDQYKETDTIDTIYTKVEDLLRTENMLMADSNLCRARQGQLLEKALDKTSIHLISDRLNKSVSFISACIKYYKLTKHFAQIVFLDVPFSNIHRNFSFITKCIYSNLDLLNKMQTNYEDINEI